MRRSLMRLLSKRFGINDGDQILAFSRGELVFVFNFSPSHSYSDYGFLVPEGSYNVVLNTDARELVALVALALLMIQ